MSDAREIIAEAEMPHYQTCDAACPCHDRTSADIDLIDDDEHRGTNDFIEYDHEPLFQQGSNVCVCGDVHGR
jgi:hypothetical protein